MFGKKTPKLEESVEKVRVSEIQVEEDNALPEPSPVLAVAQPVQVEPTKQFELGDQDIEMLNAGQYSEQAWEMVGRRHKIDHTTRVKIEGSERGYLGVPKQWQPLPPPQGQIVTTQNIDMKGLINQLPIIARDNSAGVRSALLRGDLTTPISDETHEEEV